MTKQELFDLCLNSYGTAPDYLFDEDFETAVLRHGDPRKCYAIVMRDRFIAEGIYPAYHMNKLHRVSVLLPDAPDDVVQFLVNASFEITRAKKKAK